MWFLACSLTFLHPKPGYFPVWQKLASPTSSGIAIRSACGEKWPCQPSIIPVSSSIRTDQQNSLYRNDARQRQRPKCATHDHLWLPVLQVAAPMSIFTPSPAICQSKTTRYCALIAKRPNVLRYRDLLGGSKVEFWWQGQVPFGRL